MFHFHSACENTFCVASHIFCEWGKSQYYRLFHCCKFCPRPFFTVYFALRYKGITSFHFLATQKSFQQIEVISERKWRKLITGPWQTSGFGIRRNINLINIDDICSVFYLLSILCAQLTCTLGPQPCTPCTLC